jgi:hypothetical protein
MDSGCSRHMTGDKAQFSSLKSKDGGHVTFGDDGKGKIIGIGMIGKESSNSIDQVLFVHGLKHNLLSVSQLCDKGYRVIFESTHCMVVESSTNEVKFLGKRQGNVYVIYLDELLDNDLCFVANQNEDSWMWHRRLGHASMSVITKLSKYDLVKGLPKLSFEKDKFVIHV